MNWHDVKPFVDLVTVTSIAEHVKSNLIANLHIMVKESI